MAVLENGRRERFAQSVANGEEIGKAYVDAGFKPNKGNPTTLKKRKDVQSRIAELLEERANAVTKKYAAEVEYTRETILAKLEEAFEVAREAENGSAMASATMGMAKILGMIIDRREVGDAGAFDGYTDEQLVEEAVRQARELGIAGPRLVEDDNKK
jgi:acyl-CoA reductase-like NAD-dependent aldehyde dehydrogenase